MNSPWSPLFLHQRRNRCARVERERGSRSRDRRFALRLGKSITGDIPGSSIDCNTV